MNAQVKPDADNDANHDCGYLHSPNKETLEAVDEVEQGKAVAATLNECLGLEES